MKTQRKDRFNEVIRDLSARFLSMESNRTSMITITKVASTDKGDRVTIYFTVYPENQEDAALDFAKRKRSDFRNFVRDNSRLSIIPFFEFEIDRGEKARQKIDAIAL
ncbi:MAG: ribosome-binding factor A [bacterium]|nr:ribosome-binding factor A [bacterium]